MPGPPNLRVPILPPEFQPGGVRSSSNKLNHCKAGSGELTGLCGELPEMEFNLGDGHSIHVLLPVSGQERPSDLQNRFQNRIHLMSIGILILFLSPGQFSSKPADVFYTSGSIDALLRGMNSHVTHGEGQHPHGCVHKDKAGCGDVRERALLAGKVALGGDRVLVVTPSVLAGRRIDPLSEALPFAAIKLPGFL